jgi:hypothetical protein
MRSVVAGWAVFSLVVSFAGTAAAGPRAGDVCAPPSTVNASQFSACRVVVTDSAELCRCRIAPGLQPDTLSVEGPGRMTPAAGRSGKADDAKPTVH